MRPFINIILLISLSIIAIEGHTNEPMTTYQRGVDRFNAAISQTDFKQALALFETAAKGGYAPAMDVVGVMYLNGTGADSNVYIGEAWLSGACQRKYAKGCLHLGISKERRGEGLYYKQSKRAYEDAIAYGSTQALTHLARMLKKENGKNPAAQRYATSLLARAPKDDPQAISPTIQAPAPAPAPTKPTTTTPTHLPTAAAAIASHEAGTVTEPNRHDYDMQATRKLLEPLCENEHPWVCNDLANVLLDIGGEISTAKIERLYMSAVTAKNPAAVYNLAEWYLRAAPGRSEPNWKLGVHWLETAAKMGLPEAFTLAAEMADAYPEAKNKIPAYFYQVNDTPTNVPAPDKAIAQATTESPNRADYALKQRINQLEVKLLTLMNTEPSTHPKKETVYADAKTLELAEKENQKGLLAYRNKEYVAALTHWLTAAANGSTKAMYNLGQSYQYGLGTRRDPKETERWLRRASQLGHQPSIKALVGLLKSKSSEKSSPEDIAYWTARLTQL